MHMNEGTKMPETKHMTELDRLAVEIATQLAQGALRDSRGSATIDVESGNKRSTIEVKISIRTNFKD